MGACTFNEMEIDAIGEIMNISLGASATAVSTLLGNTVHITTPVVRVLRDQDFDFRRLEPAVAVEIAYVEGLDGSNVMMFSRNDVRIIVGMLMGMEIPEENFELDEINRSAICEVMNQMMGSSATALSEFLGMTVNISTPKAFEVASEEEFREKYFVATDGSKVVVSFDLEVEGKLKSEFLNIMSEDLAKRLLKPFQAGLSGRGAPAAEQSAPVPEPVPAAEEPAASAGGGTLSQAEIEALMGGGAAAPAPEPAAPASGGTLSQAEIEALMGGGAAAPAPEPAAPASGGTLSQAEIEALMGGGAAEPAPAPAPVPEPQPMPQMQAAPQMQAMPQMQPMPQMMPVYQQGGQDPMMLQLITQMQQSQMQMMEMINEMKKGGGAAKREAPSEPSIIRPLDSAAFEGDGEGGDSEDRVNQEMLLKVPLEVSVEIGRAKKLVGDILEFTQGSLVVLDKMAGEQADLYVNGQCIARGDVVVVEDNFGIRITEIVTRNLNPETL